MADSPYISEVDLIPLELVKTGITGLDTLLKGGFVKGSTILISGNYGVGKTLFALQYAFHQASKGDKVLYVSTSEPVFKVKQFASNLDFYDESLIYSEYRDITQKKDKAVKGTIEFVESSLGIITGIHYTDESSLIEEIRNMVEGKGIQHLIIDPITTITMLYESEAVMRKDVLLMGAWLTRLGCTVLLTAEESDLKLLDVEKYLSDCVISLSSRMDDHEREFLITVQKQRGNKQNMNSHIYTFDRSGITVIHDMSYMERPDIMESQASTGIDKLDELMGGLRYGSSWILSIDDRIHYEPVFSAILSAGLDANEGIVYSPPSKFSFNGIKDLLSRFSIDIIKECKDGNAFFVDYYGRKVPDELKNFVIESYPEAEDLRIFARDKYGIIESGEVRDHWRILSNLNGEYNVYEPAGLRDRYSKNLSRVRERGDIYFSYCNFDEIDERTAEFLRTSCDGIIELYVKGKYQYLKVTKSPGGLMSSEHVIVPLDKKPFIKLMQK
ncbi:RAD55 family ATPase [Methanooceanicella nereidis]|nr:ATPase domain-containing protein [Methanocella sp. CWC-04]